jgi:hypothetical protein
MIHFGGFGYLNIAIFGDPSLSPLHQKEKGITREWIPLHRQMHQPLAIFALPFAPLRETAEFQFRLLQLAGVICQVFQLQILIHG